MATASFRFGVTEQQETGVRQALEMALRSARGLPGCREARIERDSAGHASLRFHSRWDSVNDLRVFLAGDDTGRLLQLLELSVDEPEILICWGDLQVGLSSLRAIRGAGDAADAPAEIERSACGCESRSQPSSSLSFRE